MEGRSYGVVFLETFLFRNFPPVYTSIAVVIEKVLLLNGTYDRETSGFLASCFVTAITDALNRTYGRHNNSLKNNPSQYINTIFVPKDGQIPVDIKSLATQGIVHVVPVESMHDPKVGIVYEPTALIQALANLLIGSINTQS